MDNRYIKEKNSVFFRNIEASKRLSFLDIHQTWNWIIILPELNTFGIYNTLSWLSSGKYVTESYKRLNIIDNNIFSTLAAFHQSSAKWRSIKCDIFDKKIIGTNALNNLFSIQWMVANSYTRLHQSHPNWSNNYREPVWHRLKCELAIQLYPVSRKPENINH